MTNLPHWTMVYLPEDIDDERLAQAFGAAFAVDRAAVATVPGPGSEALAAAANTVTRVLVLRDRVDGEEPNFPYGLDVGVHPSLSSQRVSRAGILQVLARELGQPVVAAIDADEQDTWHLARPDGSWADIEVDDDSNFVLTPADRDAIARRRPTATPVVR